MRDCSTEVGLSVAATFVCTLLGCFCVAAFLYAKTLRFVARHYNNVTSSQPT